MLDTAFYGKNVSADGYTVLQNVNLQTFFTVYCVLLSEAVIMLIHDFTVSQ